MSGYNCNGSCVASLSDCAPEILEPFLKSIVVSESIRYEAGHFLFWEQHYFRMMAALRRMRFPIPVAYTPEYLLSEVQKLFSFFKVPKEQNTLFHFHFVLEQGGATAFVIRFEKVVSLTANPSHTSYEVDIYREAFLSSGFLANQSILNAPIRKMASAFAKENDYDDLLLLNDQKQLVETIHGSLFWVFNQQIVTPTLASGAQNFVFRKVLIDFLTKNTQFSVIEKDSSPFDLQGAEEVFVFSLEKGLKNISQYRKTTFKSDKSKRFYTDFLASVALNLN